MLLMNIWWENMENNNSRCYIAKTRNVLERKESTSGGVFFEVAKYVIEKLDGIVYGAVFTEEYDVVHIRANNLYEIQEMRGSKYPQSKIFHLYEEVNTFVNSEKFVLFTGTPCQIVALKKYIGKDFDNLLCIDLICYGVASPTIWKFYLRKYFGNDIREIRFKDKSVGWKKWKTLISTHNYKYYLSGRTNRFMSNYMNGTYMRPACFNCVIKGERRNSDITIGDAWGEGEDSLLNDDKGLSIVVIHSELGNKIFGLLETELEIECVDFQKYISGNPYYFSSPSLNMLNNDAFYHSIEKNGIMKSFEEFCMPHGLKRVVYYYLLYKSRKRYY